MANRPSGRNLPESRGQILDRLLATAGRALRNQAARNAPSHADAEDAIQEGCLAFLRYYDGPPGDQALAYLMLAVKHCAWAIGSRVRTREAFHEVTCTDAYDPDDRFLHALCERPGPAERAERGEEVTEFFAALARLKPDERTALLLFGLGLSYREIGERQGWTNTKINRCLAEGRAALRAIDETAR